MKVYIIGSLRNPDVPVLASKMRANGITDVFDDWYAAGPEADDRWQEYEHQRGRSFAEALDGRACNHVFDYDQGHLDSSDAVVLLMPAGKSGHLEFGYAMGRGKVGFILMEGEPERFDAMYRFARQVHTNATKLIAELVDLQDALDWGPL